MLTGWAWATRYLAVRGTTADAVIQESHIRFIKPVHGELHSSTVAPPDTEIGKFNKMLRRSGRGRIRLQVHIHYEHVLATLFEGVFAATLRSEGI